MANNNNNNNNNNNLAANNWVATGQFKGNWRHPDCKRWRTEVPREHCNRKTTMMQLHLWTCLMLEGPIFVVGQWIAGLKARIACRRITRYNVEQGQGGKVARWTYINERINILFLIESNHLFDNLFDKKEPAQKRIPCSGSHHELESSVPNKFNAFISWWCLILDSLTFILLYYIQLFQIWFQWSPWFQCQKAPVEFGISLGSLSILCLFGICLSSTINNGTLE